MFAGRFVNGLMNCGSDNANLDGVKSGAGLRIIQGLSLFLNRLRESSASEPPSEVFRRAPSIRPRPSSRSAVARLTVVHRRVTERSGWLLARQFFDITVKGGDAKPDPHMAALVRETEPFSYLMHEDDMRGLRDRYIKAFPLRRAFGWFK